ncbi:hypothetical protein L6R29_01160 [Myxococcota bacterium]|nr:hypothetical protein [Myxococcota bacterium]
MTNGINGIGFSFLEWMGLWWSGATCVPCPSPTALADSIDRDIGLRCSSDRCAGLGRLKARCVGLRCSGDHCAGVGRLNARCIGLRRSGDHCVHGEGDSIDHDASSEHSVDRSVGFAHSSEQGGKKISIF